MYSNWPCFALTTRHVPDETRAGISHFKTYVGDTPDNSVITFANTQNSILLHSSSLALHIPNLKDL